MLFISITLANWVGRPQLYWGVRTTEPDGLLAGLIWWNAEKPEIRHVCNNEYPYSYYFDKHDGSNYSNEVIEDKDMKFNIEWSQINGEWIAHISGKAKNQGAVTGLAFYLGSDSKDGIFSYEDHSDVFGFSGVHNKQDVGIYFQSNGEMIKSSGFKLDSGKTWTIQQEFEKKAMDSQSLYFDTHFDLKSNVVMHRQVGKGDVDLKVVFTGNGVKAAKKLLKNAEDQFSEYKSSFGESFSLKFDVSTSSISKKKGNKMFNDEYLKYSQIAIASTIGGIGYFSGNYIVDKTPLVEDDYDPYDSQFADYFDNDEDAVPEKNKLGHRKDLENPEFTNVYELISSTPSRSHFPRGFIWDEGFHLLMIGKYDEAIGFDILDSWFNIMDSDGWIAREQILGDEARSKVPQEFQTQYTYVGNPPTLIIPIAASVERAAKISDYLSNKNTKEFDIDTYEYKKQQELNMIYQRVAVLYPKLKQNYEWFLKTQLGNSDQYDRQYDNSFVFRWRGRTDVHLFASGMDDYPRSVPGHIGELHVDLLSWMTYYAKLLSKIANTMGSTTDYDRFNSDYINGIDNLEKIHWNSKEQSYCDLTINADGKSEHTCHKGYLTIYPLMLGLIPPESDHLKPILEFIRSKQMWTNYGIRSLSLDDEFSHLGENYWRGPIWIQMNYLVCASLHKNYLHSKEKQLAVSIYEELRKNVIENVYKEFKRTGFFWEQYSDENGKGQRAKPFNGWSALVSLILFESYDGI